LFKVTSKRYSKWFFYLWTKQHLSSFRDIAANKATTMGHIQRHHLTEAKVVIPPAHILKALSAIIEPLILQSTEGMVEIKNLVALRDTLLPRLMSGKLRVDEVAV
jgi:type I restriction enzyme S subunit